MVGTSFTLAGPSVPRRAQLIRHLIPSLKNTLVLIQYTLSQRFHNFDIMVGTSFTLAGPSVPRRAQLIRHLIPSLKNTPVLIQYTLPNRSLSFQPQHLRGLTEAKAMVISPPQFSTEPKTDPGLDQTVYDGSVQGVS
jgi:NADH:ubiquinone oxidoreductase subunit D